jgi:putative ABC transport system permease protein
VSISQALVIALRSMRASRLRSALTMVGIIVGVAAVIGLVGLGQGVQTHFDQQFGAVSNSIIISKVKSATDLSDTRSLREGDVSALDHLRSPAIASVTPLRTGTAVAKFGTEEISTSVAGTDPAYIQIRMRTFAAGRMFTDQDNTAKARVVVLGPTVVSFLFRGDANAAMGKEVRLGRLNYKVVGVLDAEDDNQDNIALVPLNSVRPIFAGADTLTGIGIMASDVHSVPSALEQLRAVLDKQHDIREPGMRDYRAVSLLSQLERITGFIKLLTLFTVAVACIALFVGALGVANIMLVTVTERTHEIGIRKAIGARRAAIVKQFLTESMVLAGVGGVIGVLAGAGLTLLAARLLPSYVPELGAPELSGLAVVAAFGVSLAIGLVAGVYPAYRASRLSPIDALRY